MTQIDSIKRMVSLPDFLKFCGREPVSRNGDFLHYRSPFREDKDPSFWVNIKTEKCGDFAEGGCIGDVVNLAARWYGCDIKTAAANIADCFRLGSFSFEKPVYIPKDNPHKIHIKHVQPLQNRALLQYLTMERGISPEVARQHLQEVYYTTKDDAAAKQYFAAAFRNDKGGYAIRNKYFKGCSAPNGITTISQNSDTVVVFEGFMDYLSCIEYWRSCHLSMPYDVVVLNSTVNATRIDLSKYTSIKLLLDNDAAGRNTANKIAMQYPDKTSDITPKLIPPDCKDFNDFWVKQIPK